MKNRKHEGIGLATGLVITAFGLFLTALMFGSVVDFTRIFSGYRREYSDSITASSYIEKLKGNITAINNSGSEVLHGAQNQNPAYPANSITGLNGLLITGRPELIINEEINVNGRQRIEARVYDASYNVRGLDEGFIKSDDFRLAPPSFLIQRTVDEEWGNIGKNGEYEDPADFASSLTTADLHRRYGAYLIRVSIFNVFDDGRELLARTTEEAFRQLIE